MEEWEEEVSVTLTKSQWLEVLLGLWDRHHMVESQTDITEEVKQHWFKEIEGIQKEIRLLTNDAYRNRI